MRGVPGEHAFFIRAKAKKIEALAVRVRCDSSRLRLLDIGCGAGLVEKFLRIPNADITGLDVSEQLLERARENAPGCRFTHFDGQNIDDEDNSYHLVFAINVFHHIPIKTGCNCLWRCGVFFSQTKSLLYLSIIPGTPSSGLSSPDVASIAMQCFSANQMRVRCYLRQACIASIRLT